VLNRSLLARQRLLERATLPVSVAMEQVGGLQTQYAPAGYVGLWSRLAGLTRDDLTNALVDRSVVQGTLMRSTIHMVSAADYEQALGTLIETVSRLLDVETGAWTLPVYLRRLHASIFSDVGDAWMPFDDGPFRAASAPFRLHAGAGAELHVLQRSRHAIAYAKGTEAIADLLVAAGAVQQQERTPLARLGGGDVAMGKAQVWCAHERAAPSGLAGRRSGGRMRSMAARRDSSQSGSFNAAPSPSTVSSVAKPGGSVAIS